MIDDLVLMTLEDNPDIDSADIDANWKRTMAFAAAVKLAIEQGMVNIASASTEGGGLTFTMTNGVTIGPLEFSGLPIQPAGVWTEGSTYDRGDIVTHEGGSAMVAFAHEAEDFEVDVLLGRLVVLAAPAAPSDGGGTDPGTGPVVGNARPMVQRFGALGPVSNVGEKLIDQFLVPYDCRLTSDYPILGAITTPIAGNASSLNVLIRKVSPTLGVSDLTTVTFAPGSLGAMKAVDANLAAGDGLQIIQIDGNSSTGGANWTITMCFAERAEA